MQYLSKVLNVLIVSIALISCSKDIDDSILTNDFLKKTEAPPVVGEPIDFAYAIATKQGKLSKATATVSIEGAPGTGFETRSYYTNSAGAEIGIAVADTATKGSVSTATFKVDTNAVTLRFKYIIPEAARGKTVRVSFRAETKEGLSITLSSEEYKVSTVDLARNVVMTNNNACYFSLETMKSYTEAQVNANNLANKIDLVYHFKATTPGGGVYGHSLLSTGTASVPLNGKTIPANFEKKSTKMEKKAFINDMLLSGIVPSTYVDDTDFQTLNLNNAADYIVDLRTTSRNSVFVESADGKYRAYLYINNATATNLTFSMKRYTTK
jgi:hypothetical protein